MSDSSTDDRYLAVIGNPGVGKSTLLNSSIGASKFKSGGSKDGKGITVAHQVYEHDGVQYIDSPGLADADEQRRKQAAVVSADAVVFGKQLQNSGVKCSGAQR